MKLGAIRAIWKNTKGASVIEYALALPLFLLFICVCMEYSLMAFADVQLSSAVFSLSRLVKTGQFNSGLPANPTQAQINSAVQSTLISQLVPSYLFHASNLTINTEYFADFSNIGQMEPCMGANMEPCSGTGQYNDINSDKVRDLQGGSQGAGAGGNVVLYSASYQWTGVTPVWNLINYLSGGHSAGGNTLAASVLVKSEPFPTTGR